MAGAGQETIVCVCSSYDTKLEPIAEQVSARVRELEAVFPEGGPVRAKLLIVNDADDPEAFERQVDAAIRVWSPARRSRLRLVRLQAVGSSASTHKGRALRHGFEVALREEAADYVAYVNLNLKVPLSSLGVAFSALEADALDVVIGSRARGDGGQRVGAGVFGELKSFVYNCLARAAFEPLRSYGDLNGPIKLMRGDAAQKVLERGRIEGVTFDMEWLLIWHAADLSVGRVPICWTQRPGSRPPWHLTTKVLAELIETRGAWRRGSYQ